MAKSDTSGNASDLAKKFSEFAGREDQYDVREVTGADGTKQTQLIDKTTGSISAVWEGELPKADEVTGSLTSTPAVNPVEAVEDNKKFRTSEGVLATPTQPEAIEGSVDATEIDNSDKSGRKENQVATPTSNQRVTKSE